MDYLNLQIYLEDKLMGRCLRPALSAHTPAGLNHRAGIRYYR
jgi:hypothetical protein